MAEAGYSGTPLARKLGLAPGMRVLLLHAPADYAVLIGPTHATLDFAARAGPSVALVHLFCDRRAALAKALPALRAALAPAAMVWVSWPKRSSGVASDIGEDTVREVALPLGFVDVKVCAVDATWSALKLVVRKALR